MQATSTQADKSNTEDVQMQEATQMQVLPASAMRVIEVQVEFKGVSIPAGKLQPGYKEGVVHIPIPRDADYEELTHEFFQIVRKYIFPEWLMCLVLWSTEIGSDTRGFERAEEGKTLDSYPGAGDRTMTGKISIGFMQPTANNLRSSEPKVLTELPTPQQFIKWMKALAESVGVQFKHNEYLDSNATGHDGGDRKGTHDAGKNAEVVAEAYGHLVDDIREGLSISELKLQHQQRTSVGR